MSRIPATAVSSSGASVRDPTLAPCRRRRANRAPAVPCVARTKRERERRARPRLAVSEQREHCCVLFFDRTRQHDHVARAARNQSESARRRAHAGQWPKHLAEPTDFDPQSRTMRLVGALCAERACNQRVSRNVCRPRFGQRAHQREQHRTFCERDHGAVVVHRMAARVDDECLRSEQCFHFREQQRTLFRVRDQPRGRRVQRERHAFDLGRQRRDACVARCTARPSSARRVQSRRGYGAAQFQRRAARGWFSRPAGTARDRAWRALARPRRAARSAASGGPRDSARAPRSPGRRALRASRVHRRARSAPSRDRAKRARPPPRRRCSWRAPPLLSRRTRAPHAATALSLERDHPVAPSRCRAERVPARRRAARRA